MGKHKRILGSRKYADYNEVILQECIQKIKNKELTAKKASEIYNIPRRTLFNKMNNKHSQNIGKPTVYSFEEENKFVNHLNIIADFGFPVTKEDLKVLIRTYNEKTGRKIARFKDEKTPGKDWIDGFLKRHKQLSIRFAANIKRVRADVSEEMIREYMENLQATIADIPPNCIYNCDESNLSDDPGRKKVIAKKGSKYPELVCNTSKIAYSIMICRTAAGELLPPYVVYKSTYLYDTWTEGGPPGARYDCTTSGWFDNITFANWFRRILIPHARKKDGPKVVICDNLSSHINMELRELCEVNQIKLVCLPPNTTHISQPLDVGFFAPMKRKWRKILYEWKMTINGHRNGTLPKQEFPHLLKLLFEKLNYNAKENLISAFTKCSIIPCDVNKLLARLPECRNKENPAVEESFVSFLTENRKTFVSDGTKRPKKRLKVQAGKNIFNNSDSDEVDDPLPVPSISIPSNRSPVMVTNSPINHAEINSTFASSPTDYSSISISTSTPSTNSSSSIEGRYDSSMSLQDAWVLVEFNKNKKSSRHFIGQIITLDPLEAKYLRRVRRTDRFTWPIIEDRYELEVDNIVKFLNPPHIDKWNKLTFQLDMNNYKNLC